MITFTGRRQLWFFWFAALACWIAIVIFPVSNRLTRWVGLVLVICLWVGLIALLWRRRRVRFALLSLTAMTLILGGWPRHARPDVITLRQEYSTSLRRYTGVQFCWGGENFDGVDGPGLVRRGLIDALVYRGIRSFYPELVRYATWLWWHDCTAKDLGEGFLTIHMLDARSLNDLEPARLRPGDLAVTMGGEQVLAYLGERVWIEADPGLGRVITISAPSLQSAWFNKPMRIMRWRILDR